MPIVAFPSRPGPAVPSGARTLAAGPTATNRASYDGGLTR